jgi:hypothetical protein
MDANPANFAAATTTVTPDDGRKQFACGPDVQRHLEVVTQFVDAGFDHLVLQNAGPDPEGFIDFFQRDSPSRCVRCPRSAVQVVVSGRASTLRAVG